MTEIKESRKPNAEKPIAICVSGGRITGVQSGSGGTHPDTDTLIDIATENVRVEEGGRVITTDWVVIDLAFDSEEDDTAAGVVEVDNVMESIVVGDIVIESMASSVVGIIVVESMASSVVGIIVVESRVSSVVGVIVVESRASSVVGIIVVESMASSVVGIIVVESMASSLVGVIAVEVGIVELILGTVWQVLKGLVVVSVSYI